MTTYAVTFYIEDNELVYDTGKTSFTCKDPPILFNTKEEAEIQAAKWNTGRVVKYND